MWKLPLGRPASTSYPQKLIKCHDPVDSGRVHYNRQTKIDDDDAADSHNKDLGIDLSNIIGRDPRRSNGLRNTLDGSNKDCYDWDLFLPVFFSLSLDVGCDA